MRQEHRRQLALVLILLIALSGCDTSRHSSRSSLSDNGRFMALWNTYTHCLRSEDLEAMRTDTHRLIRAVHRIDSAENPTPLERSEPIPLGPTIRLSVDPAVMAAACALRAGQAAQEMGRLSIAREMFHTIVLHFSQPGYQYYTDRARLGLEHVDAISRAASLSRFTI